MRKIRREGTSQGDWQNSHRKKKRGREKKRKKSFPSGRGSVEHESRLGGTKKEKK